MVSYNGALDTMGLPNVGSNGRRIVADHFGGSVPERRVVDRLGVVVIDDERVPTCHGRDAHGAARSVGGASVDDPLVGLAGDLGDEFEVGVVVEDREAAGFGGRGDEGVDEGQGSVLSSS